MSGSLRSLYSDNGQEYANNLRGYLDTNGIPPTAENLNRISLAVSQEMRGGTPELNFDAAVERTMAPRGGRRAAAAAPQPEVRVNAGMEEGADPAQQNVRAGAMSGNAHTADTNPGPVRDQMEGQTRGAQVAEANRRAGGPSGDANGIGTPNDTARPGTIPRARYIDENDPTAGMFDPNAVGGRQADETGVDQTGLGMALLAPLAGGAAALAGRGLVGRLAAQRAVQQPGTAVAVPQNPYANVTGIRPNPPPAAAPQIASAPPQIPGSGGAANALPAPAPQVAAPVSTPPRVTITGRNGASAVRNPNSNAMTDPVGRTALTRRMIGRRSAQGAE